MRRGVRRTYRGSGYGVSLTLGGSWSGVSLTLGGVSRTLGGSRLSVSPTLGGSRCGVRRTLGGRPMSGVIKRRTRNVRRTPRKRRLLSPRLLSGAISPRGRPRAGRWRKTVATTPLPWNPAAPIGRGRPHPLQWRRHPPPALLLPSVLCSALHSWAAPLLGHCHYPLRLRHGLHLPSTTTTWRWPGVPDLVVERVDATAHARPVPQTRDFPPTPSNSKGGLLSQQQLRWHERPYLVARWCRPLQPTT